MEEVVGTELLAEVIGTELLEEGVGSVLVGIELVEAALVVVVPASGYFTMLEKSLSAVLL